VFYTNVAVEIRFRDSADFHLAVFNASTGVRHPAHRPSSRQLLLLYLVAVWQIIIKIPWWWWWWRVCHLICSLLRFSD